MYKNFKKTFSGELWENLAWGATRAYKLPELRKILGLILKTDKAALDWLDIEDRHTWARAHFDSTSKCDELTNNFNTAFLVMNTQTGTKYVVDIVKKTCTCIEWQMSECHVYMLLQLSGKEESHG
ncbi:hypothetical protein IFM89_025133 [Coptis chinensis]|uniref:SWIM-type domain-containing protein n=1 Tax=Coptis chinensis TaxID=261450 RepID=A0A835J200_9MAGN|nr:hypothetical protein IFM89_025133 [Coptis chinensis]